MKRFALYVGIWGVLLALFNAIAFVSVGWIGYEKYTPSFWIGYGYITAMFIGQLICSFIAFRANSAEKLFYRIPLIRKSYAGLVLSFFFGGLCMIISPMPYWMGGLICSVFLALNLRAVIKVSFAISEVERIDSKVKANTFFIKNLTAEAESLISRAKSESVKSECKKVYEAVRYSDPISNGALTSIESEITIKFSKLSDAVVSEDSVAVVILADEITILLGDRNKKCKLLK